MATTRTLDFLPSVFQTDTNRKFLSATLDQLVSEPDFTRLNGYIGRKFAPTYKSGDSYLTEVNSNRQNYQLEPSLVIKDSSNAITHYSSYTDLVNKISYYGGKTTNHDRLFSSEYYTYNGKFDYDKFVNFGQYYWLPNGPDAVVIDSTSVNSQETYLFSRNASNNNFGVVGQVGPNPEITLIRGGLYKFQVNSPGSKFWIQTEPGISGVKKVSPTVSTRIISGVQNNGRDNGTIEFSVPLADSQDLYLKMPIVGSVNYAVETSFSALDGAVWADVIAQYGGLDGMDISPDNKIFIFLNLSTDDADWTRADGSILDEKHRRGVWRIRIDNAIVKLDYIKDVNVNSKVYVRSGRTHAATEYYRSQVGAFIPVPTLTAQLDTLYYQDSADPKMYGRIRIVDKLLNSINVEESIVGKTQYTSQSGVAFSNGMVVQFDSNTLPARFANNTFVVEGVGIGITLVEFNLLVTPEPGQETKTVPWGEKAFDGTGYDAPLLGPANPDYLVCNRSSLDLNAWARGNRWFHSDIIIASAALNGSVPMFDQNARAVRPIIEFDPSIQLFNNGRIGKRPVDHIDTTITDAFNQVQHNDNLTIGDLTFKVGERVLFANDKDPLVRSQIYNIAFDIKLDPSYKTIYDGTGAGTVTVEAKTINYAAVSDPILLNPVIDIDTYDINVPRLYRWEVISDDRILLANRLEGLEFPSTLISADIVSVTAFGVGRYAINFTTTVPISIFVQDEVLIKSSQGSTHIVGTGTKFTSDLRVGSGLYNSVTEELIGIVASIGNDTRLTLQDSPAHVDVDFVFVYQNPKIQLLVSPDPNDALLEFDTIVSVGGANAGVTVWYDGNVWTRAQQKTALNQSPQFDVYDFNDASFGSSSYPASKFRGNPIFSYGRGTGRADKVLGFALSYNNVSSTVADISFVNSFDSDTFEYTSGTNLASKAINLGYLRKNQDRYQFDRQNVWSTAKENTKQYQIISSTFTKTNYFEIDVLPAGTVTVPNLKVFLNNVLLEATQYSIVQLGVKNAIRILSTLTVGDKIDILIYSNSASQLGYYQIPTNLDYNSKNQSLKAITLGQLRNHLAVNAQNTIGIVGLVPGVSNIRDLDIKQQGGNLLQQAAPSIYASLFLIDNQANFINGLDYARREYTKFKNKFVELSTTLPGLNYSNPSTCVDTILTVINQVKNKSFSWYYSDMVPYGQYTSTQYVVNKLANRQYKLTSTFSENKLQGRAVLIYLNGYLLTKDRDYTFDPAKPAVYLDDSVNITIGAELEIREYNTDGNYIPETPTKLGLYPKFLPAIVQDDTYRESVDVLQGHDGSLSPVFGDYRDQLMLELETRIYNNIKTNHEYAALDVRKLVPGRFRKTDYTLSEFNNIIGSTFLKWAGTNKVDYTTNSYFVSNDPFTYNYKYSTDRLFNQPLPGHWRGIHRYFYDTDKPHTHPWEMLGFSEQPQWWTATYGPAPYTSSNTPLWEDLAAGMVRGGDSPGIDTSYARPRLLEVLPVDEAGNLQAPLGRISAKFSSSKAGDPYAIGDCGPAESAWRRTSEYPFALQSAAALMKPARYFGTLFNTNQYYRNGKINQYLTTTTHRRVTPADLTLNGETVNGSVTRAGGYVNYVLDYLTSLGIPAVTKVRTMLTNLEVQLTYKVAGYTDKNYLTVLAEQYSPTSTNASVVIPDDSYTVYLSKGVPTQRIAYSAVIVEKTDTGYSVRGYNTDNPYFIIVPSETSGTNYSITVDGVVGVIYENYRRQKLSIPYGQQFSTRQQLVDFLVSYQRYLVVQGFAFGEFNSDLGQPQDWTLSAREFLSWTVQGWKTGSILVLSPCETKLTVNTFLNSVDEITNSANNSRVLDTNFGVIRTTEFTVIRDTDQFVLQSTEGKTIAFAELNLVQFEHVLIFDNATVFNDIIYKPELGSRQFRLKLIGDKTAGWGGALNPPGFIYNNSTVAAWQQGKDYLKGDIVVYKNFYYVAAQDIPAVDSFKVTSWKQIDKSSIKTGLLSNFSNNAGRFVDFYDVDATTLDKQLQKMSSGLLGFRSRSYLDNLNIDHNSQIKFYQGYIKEKGTKNAIDALLGASFNNLTNNVSYFEEWGVRVGEYGAQDSNQTVALIVDESAVKSNPVGLVMTTPGQSLVSGLINVSDRELYARPYGDKPVLLLDRTANTNTENDIETAGYVNLNDVDATLFDASASYVSLDSNLSEISSGYTVWVAKDNNTSWQVYRANETDNLVEKIEYNLDLTAKVTTRNPHNFSELTTIVIKQFDPLYDGFYSVAGVLDRRSFTVQISSELNQSLKQNPATGSGTLFQMSAVRFASPGDIARVSPKHGWKDGDRAWVDTDETGGWAVYQKSNPWNYGNALTIQRGTYTAGAQYGSSVRIDPAQKYLVSGAPDDNSGTGRIRVFSTNHEFKERGVIHPYIADIKELGFCVDMIGNYIVAGAPGTNLGTGLVILYQNVNNLYFNAVQALPNPDGGAAAKFGYSVSMSKNGQWLYTGAPGNDAVYSYKFVTVQSRTPDQFKANDASTEYRLVNTITNDPDSLAVYNNNRLLVRDRDYITDGKTITISISLISESGDIFITEDGLDLTSESTGGDPGYILVRARSYYKYIGKIVGETNTQFGSSIQTTVSGRIIVVGQPNATTDTVINAGRAIVYKNDDYNIANPNINAFSVVQKLQADTPTYQAKFGTSIDICKNNCSIYIGAPGYSESDYSGGAVYRFVDSGLVFGVVTGDKVNPTVRIGDSLIINEVTVVFTGTTLDSVVADITESFILGITATNTAGRLVISSNVVLKFRKLDVLPGSGTAISDLGITIFDRAQKIVKPLATLGENFGSQVKISASAETLLVSSTKGTVETYGTFDAKSTTFDGLTTRTLDITRGSGAVYLHEFLPNSAVGVNRFGDFAFANEFNAPNLQLGDQFGHGIDISDNFLIIGAALNDSKSIDGGQAFYYTNPTATRSWAKTRTQSSKVDVTGINRMFLYNKNTKSMLSTLDYIDPAKGKLFGIVDQDLDFKSTRDPANYNAGNGSNKSIETDFYWGAAHVGRTWWNLDTIRYIDYEQQELTYRLNNWGRLFPGSLVQVCEWVESLVTPDKYVKSGALGTPLYADNEYYVQTTSVDNATGIIRTKYYFWVQGITAIPAGSTRSLSIVGLASAIQDPSSQGIPFAAVLSNNSVGLFNCQEYLNSTNTVLQIDYDTVLNSKLMHNEFELIQEGNGNNTFPARIINKLVDSIAGADEQNSIVPDVSLRSSQKVGLGLRPRQTLVLDQYTGLKNIVQYVNGIFAGTTAANKLQNTLQFDKTSFYLKDNLPPRGSYDYRAADLAERNYVPKIAGTKILVESDLDHYGIWTIYEIQSDLSYRIVRNQAYDTTKFWNFDTWYDTGYDPATKPTYVVDNYAEIEKINVVAGDIVKVSNTDAGGFEIYQYTSQFENKLVALENGTLALSQELWDLSINKIGMDNSAFDSVTFDYNHSIEVRNIMAGLKNDVLVDDLKDNYNQLLFVIVNYIMAEQVNVDWIFKTSFINVLHKIRQLAQYPNYIRDNHEYYLDYINEVKPYRTKVRDYRISYNGLDAAKTQASDFDLPGYYDSELKVYRSPDGKYPEIDGALLLKPEYSPWANNFLFTINTIDIIDPGHGFTETPQVKIVSTDNSGRGATATCSINPLTGKVIGVTVTNGGSGYRNAPIVTINGDGTGARVVARLINGKVRGIKTTLKFDRVSYNTAVTEWIPGKEYTTGDMVSYKNTGYVASEDLPGTARFELKATAGQKVFAVPGGYYNSGIVINGTPAGGIKSVRVNGQLLSATQYRATNGNTVALVTAVSLNAKVVIIKHKNINASFNLAVFEQIKDEAYTNANDRIAALYNPLDSQIPKEINSQGQIDLTRLVPGVKFDGHQVDSNQSVTSDTSLETYNLYSTGGDAASDINLSGGALDSSVHSPEELVPGVTYDNLALKVFTDLGNGTTVAYRISQNLKQEVVYTAISGAKSTELEEPLAWDDDAITVTNGALLMTPNPRSRRAGLLYINGEAISYWDKQDNVISRITRGVGGTGTPAVHAAGSRVEDAGPNLKIPGTTQILSHNYQFDPMIGVTATGFTVSGDLAQTKNLLSVRINLNILPAGEYYSVDQDANGRVIVTFSEIAKQRISAGTLVFVEYYKDTVWIELGTGTGLAGSSKIPALFLKNNPYI